VHWLVFCDLDGTVLTYDCELRPAVRQAMQAVIDTGSRITLASGRGFQFLEQFLGVVPINAPLVCCNGALVIEPTTRKVLHLEPMPLTVARSVLEWGHRNSQRVLLTLGDMVSTLEYFPESQGAILRKHEIEQYVDNPFTLLTSPPHKAIVMPGSSELVNDVVAQLSVLLGDRARVVVSSPKIVEILTPGVSKVKGMSLVADMLGIHRKDTIAIGDGDNDVEMLSWAGLAIAMANATEAAKSVADWIAPSVEDDGLAHALQRFVLRDRKHL
jgi:Cof subfamily protein (haloacid dehalogenase superfamily)